MHKLISALMACLMLFTVLTVSAEDTVYIDSAEDLCALSARVAAGDRMTDVSVVLRVDITLEGDFTPIGTDTSKPFSGSFDGGGHTVRGLSVQGDAYLGLFGCITDGSVKNLIIENATVSGGDYCGLLVGRLYAYKGDGVVENCQVSGTVTGGSYVGGLAGMVCAAAYDNTAEAQVKDCSVHATAEGDIYVGGIAGCAEARGNSKTATVLIKDCVSEGFVRAEGSYGTMAGGICGALSAKDNGGNAVAELDACTSYAMAVAEKLAAGGIIGTAGSVGEYSIAAATNSVAYGYVSGGAKVGGICGKAETDGGTTGFENCIAVGCVVGADIDSVGFGATGCARVETAEWLDLAGYSVGDANFDGEVDSLDAATVLKIDAELAIKGVNCDFNGDNTVDSLDAAQILKYDAGLIE